MTFFCWLRKPKASSEVPVSKATIPMPNTNIHMILIFLSLARLDAEAQAEFGGGRTARLALFDTFQIALD
ncbi:hypothetical protein BpHYR1_047427 [Brachionus plicatilis]|uniref:Uncharacterized protein n=1 Tax=Brachionus plicatilis TaxID=10195 RepID=A0A3M7T269_BRAPC|nr:hypothetical protein BpHYR1_047427 [Brachionus plicatilis]